MSEFVSSLAESIPDVNVTVETVEDRSEAILITGGRYAEQSAELFLPWQNTTCELPPLPDKRVNHAHVVRSVS